MADQRRALAPRALTCRVLGHVWVEHVVTRQLRCQVCRACYPERLPK